jgi:uncharacterized membrane protein YphA (DoxX/SURF4 family)
MKSTKIIYWTSTILFAGFMLMTSIQYVMLTPETVDFITKLGYPAYIVPFLGIAKIIGSIIILIPSFRKIKEWAYAGLFIDLIGATFSLIKVYGINPSMSFMLLIIIIGVLSYIYNSKMYFYSKQNA